MAITDDITQAILAHLDLSLEFKLVKSLGVKLIPQHFKYTVSQRNCTKRMLGKYHIGMCKNYTKVLDDIYHDDRET